MGSGGRQLKDRRQPRLAMLVLEPHTALITRLEAGCMAHPLATLLKDVLAGVAPLRFNFFSSSYCFRSLEMNCQESI